MASPALNPSSLRQVSYNGGEERVEACLAEGYDECIACRMQSTTSLDCARHAKNKHRQWEGGRGSGVCGGGDRVVRVRNCRKEEPV